MNVCTHDSAALEGVLVILGPPTDDNDVIDIDGNLALAWRIKAPRPLKDTYLNSIDYFRILRSASIDVMTRVSHVTLDKDDPSLVTVCFLGKPSTTEASHAFTDLLEKFEIRALEEQTMTDAERIAKQERGMALHSRREDVGFSS